MGLSGTSYDNLPNSHILRCFEQYEAKRDKPEDKTLLGTF